MSSDPMSTDPVSADPTSHGTPTGERPRVSVERDGHVLVLRHVVMGPKDYRGVQLIGSAAGGKYRGGYGEVAAARPGGGAASVEPDLTADNPL